MSASLSPGTSRTIGAVVTAARQILNDTAPSTGSDLSGTQSSSTIGDALTAVRRQLNDMRSDYAIDPSAYSDTYGQVFQQNQNDVTVAQAEDQALNTLYYGDLAQRTRNQLGDFMPTTITGLPAGSLSSNATLLTIGGLVADIRLALNDPAVNPIENAYWPSTSPITDTGVLGSAPNAPGGGLLFAIASARSILNDTDVNSYRYTDADLTTYFADAAATAFRLRPDAFVYAFDISQVTNHTSIYLPLYTEFYPVLVDYVVGRAQARDDSSADEVKSAAYYEAFRTSLLRGPYRHSNAFIQAAIREAFGYVLLRRSDLVMPDIEIGTAFIMPTDPAAEWPLMDWTYPLFINFVVAKAHLRNDAMTLAPGPLAALGNTMLGEFASALEQAPYRISDQMVLTACTEAVGDMLRRRPDLFPEGLWVPPALTQTAGTPCPVPDDYFPAAVDATLLRLLSRVSFDEKDQIAMLQARYDAAMSQGPFRHTQVLLFHLFNQALLHVRRRRPDLTLDDTTAQPIYVPGNETLPFPLDDAYMPLVIDYVAAQAMRRDAMLGGDGASVGPLLAGVDAQLDAAPFRYSDGALYTLVTEAIGETRRVRPDLWLGMLRAPLPSYTAAAATTPFPIDEAYFAPVVSYVVGRAQQRDRPGPDDGKAPAFLALFSRQMGAA